MFFVIGKKKREPQEEGVPLQVLFAQTLSYECKKRKEIRFRMSWTLRDPIGSNYPLGIRPIEEGKGVR